MKAREGFSVISAALGSVVFLTVANFWLGSKQQNIFRLRVAFDESRSVSPRWTPEPLGTHDNANGFGAKNTILPPALFENGELLDGGSGKHCLQWAVVSTIHAPNESIFRVSNLRGWCLIIVGDTNTPNNAHADLAAEKDNVFFLSALDQEKFLSSGTSLSGSFARKNIGYLYALSHGAKVLFDFDDDNVLTPPEGGTVASIAPPFLFSEDSGFDTRTMLLKFIDEDDAKENENETIEQPTTPASKYQGPLAFNPYIYMGASQDYTWPRGFPIDKLPNNFHEWYTYKQNTVVGDIKLSSIGVIQSLCVGDPDHDTVYRSTRHAAEFTFDNSIKALPLLVPLHKYSPYNAQATTHLYHAFWGLYLPITVQDPVADIWRSYINQRVMKDIGLHVMYTPPIVSRIHIPHNHLSEYVAETDLHTKTTKLLEFLDAWSSEAETLVERIMELWIALHKSNYIGLDDVEGISKWLNALDVIDYEFPSVGKDGVAGTDMPALNSQPMEEGQPYRSFPYFDNNKEALSTEGRSGRPDNAVLKLIMITMDEWPLLKYWVMVSS